MVMRVLLRRSSCGSGRARRTSFRLPGLALVLALTLVGRMLAVVPSASAGVLDPAQPRISNVQGLVSDTSNWAQTFTNGVSGGLDQIDIAVVRQGAGTDVIAPPTSKQQCKKGGWRRFANPSFKNQGQCVAYVNRHDGKGKDDQNGSSGTNKGHGKKR